jgi:hypothetical protein
MSLTVWRLLQVNEEEIVKETIAKNPLFDYDPEAAEAIRSEDTTSSTTMKRKREADLLQFLPDAILVEVAVFLMHDVNDFVRFQRVNKRVHTLLSGDTIVQELIQTSLQQPQEDNNNEENEGRIVCYTLEELALYQAVARELDLLEENRIGFDYASLQIDDDDGEASGIENSETRIQDLRRFLLSHQFPNATIVVHAHCGTGAPSGIAPRFSAARGQCVAASLITGGDAEAPEMTGFVLYSGNHPEDTNNHQAGRVELHFDDENAASAEMVNLCDRIEVNAWGRRVALIVRNSTHPYSELASEGKGWAELYIHMGDHLQLPPKPRYYDGLYTV